MGVLLEVISDIHRVLWVNADPMDVRNDSQQDTRPQAVSSSNFLCEFWECFRSILQKSHL